MRIPVAMLCLFATISVGLSPVAAATMSADEKAAKSKECSAQAEAKGLHGKARKHFRSACRRGKT